MKINLSKTLSFLLIGAAVLTACDNISEDERYIELDKIEAKRAVLLEEFTGQRCTNCPDGHKVVHDLREQYGDRVIPVCIHGGKLSVKTSTGAIVGLANNESEAYYTAAGSPDLPAAAVNRTTGCIDRSEWPEAVRREMEKDTPANIELSAKYVDGTIVANAKVISNIDLSCSLQFWVLENNIIAYQLDHGQNVMDYQHDHVFRATMNGQDGEKISVKKDVYADFDASIACSEKWNAENLTVVAILSDASGVLQAAEAEVE